MAHVDFIRLSGNIITARFRTDTTFIIRMGIDSTISLRTFGCFGRTSMLRIMQRADQSITKGILRKYVLLRLNGMVHQRAGRGIRSVDMKIGKCKKRGNMYAQSAEPFS